MTLSEMALSEMTLSEMALPEMALPEMIPLAVNRSEMDAAPQRITERCETR
jgi:hypothetical protein